MHTAGAEFQLIQRYFQQQAELHLTAGVSLGIGDDCAILQPNPNTDFAISVDTSIANRHFPDNANAATIAARALNVALSDLAAMGAKPLAFTLALSLPQHFDSYPENTRDNFMAAFSRGLFAAASNAQVALIGGDTTVADMPLSISVTVYGELPVGQALKRKGAQVGESIYISRATGEAGAGLQCWLSGVKAPADLINAYLNPQPELVLGPKLLLLNASSCIDVSDGLISDLQHILSASSVSAVIDCDALLNSSSLVAHCGKVKALEYALTAGDDYCLCFTGQLSEQDIQTLGVIRIGEITLNNNKSTLVLNHQPKQLQLSGLGYDHFKS